MIAKSEEEEEEEDSKELYHLSKSRILCQRKDKETTDMTKKNKRRLQEAGV